MRRLCTAIDRLDPNQKVCEDTCEKYETCEPRKTGIKFGFNVDTYMLNSRIRSGRCTICGGDLCEHRLTYKEGARRF